MINVYDCVLQSTAYCYLGLKFGRLKHYQTAQMANLGGPTKVAQSIFGAQLDLESETTYIYLSR